MRPTVLCILDGFGLNPNPTGNAVALAKKPNFDRVWSECPHTTLTTFGERVGLPHGQMGNSEVGHLNIGAGRVVEQWLLRISRALEGEALAESPAYQRFITETKESGALHLVGLFSDGGVHSHSEHLYKLIERVSMDWKGPIFLHLITDGRDTSTTRSLEQLPELLIVLKAFPHCKIASISGRYFAMDRDKRWDRTKKAYDVIANAEGPIHVDPLEGLKTAHKNGVTDEFIEPFVVFKAPINEEDGIIFWNFREDRMREIVAALCLKDFPHFARSSSPPAPGRVLCFTDYDHTFHLPFLFPILNIKNHLGEILARRDEKQLRVAETEKYPHVTYFFNGGVEKQYPGEERKLVPSPREVKTYDLKPEMSARGVCDLVLEGLRSKTYSLIVVNFANCDMVGHTGVLQAGIKAVETVDGCLGEILEELKRQGGQALITADHGNADQMINYEDGTPHTTHTLHPVPCVLFGVSGKVQARDGGALCDIAPTLLKMMGIEQPKEMTGQPLY